MEPVNIKEFEQIAKLKLPKSLYEYFASGANEELTLRRNLKAFKDILIIPQVLKDTSNVTTNVTILENAISFPLMIAPTAFQCAAHPDGEHATVRAVTQAKIAMIVSTLSNMTLEEISIAGECPLWFQLYIYKNRNISENLVKRAEKAGYRGLVVTVDTPIMGRREKDIRNQFKLPTGLMPKNFSDNDFNIIAEETLGSRIKNYTDEMFDQSFTWDDILWLRTITKLPIIIKGIMHPDDAERAVSAGVNAIIVSNHGGRQLDCVPATIEILPIIFERIGGKVPIVLDGGIRKGTDIFKALALGADIVLIGRPVLWALTFNGEAGVYQLLEQYRVEFKETMVLTGCNSIKQIKQLGRSLLKIPNYF